MANFLPIVRILETTNIEVRGLGHVVVDPATIEVGNNSVVARCRIAGKRGFKMIKCYLSSCYRAKLKGVDYYPQSLRVFSFYGGEEYVDVAIGRWIDGKALDVMLYRGDCDIAAFSLAFDIMALSHLRSGAIHGDIKPENIIVLPSGQMKLIDSDALPIESCGNCHARDYGSEYYAHRHRRIRRTDQSTDHYSLALISALIAAMSHVSTFFSTKQTIEEYIASATEVLKEHNDTLHYDMIVAMQHSIMGKIDGLEALFESIVMAHK